ncbi:MAG: DUF11 domain-containing protein [Chloroflexi bacterium]|nr:DUF11 domain-containing protein [Chloroflexota bacterium]
MNRLKQLYIPLLGFLLVANLVAPVGASRYLQAGTTYYVSSSGGGDDNDGFSEGAPFETIAKVNSLDLQPGDSMLFKCGDTWRAEMLTITQSGTAGNPITFGSYPADCADQPILSGAQPVSGWTSHSANIYVAPLGAGQNAGKFGYGVNQLFRNDERLMLGRWPNLDTGDAGYSTIDAHSSSQITDNELPSGDWTGAAAHIKGMRWYILNREVTGDSAQTLTLGAYPDCWGGCTGWGYFLNRHLSTLDREGEWYYDAATDQVYLYTTGGAPSDGKVEGSVVLQDDDRSWGGITLGEDLNEPGIAYVVVENLDVRRWFRHGIATPTNHAHYENHHITLQNNTISDVDGMGINLMSWVWGAEDGRADGWRGGYNMTVDGNTIDTANRMGINLYSRDSTISDNVIHDVGVIENLGAAGLGCDFDDGGGQCTEDGDGIRIKIDEADDSGNNNTVMGNRLERIAYNGVDVFGYANTFEHNVIQQVCYTKGDCGGVRTFGRDNLSQTAAHDLVFNENMIIDTLGNTDGCHNTYKSLFGFGFYIDHYSRDVTLTGNTVISSTVHGILYQDSTGTITDNTMYNNSRTANWSGQVWLTGSPTYVSAHTDNVLYNLNGESWTLSMQDSSVLGTSDRNYFFSPYEADHIRAVGDHSLASWQGYSGKDGNSKESWFTLGTGEAPLSHIFYNDTARVQEIDLGTAQYLDLDQNRRVGSISLQPYTSQILIYDGEAVPDLSPSTKTASAPGPTAGDLVTYTITVHNLSGPITHTVALTDVVPSGLDYVSGTLHASSGTWDDALAPTLTWTGVLTPVPTITITYAVTVPYVVSGTATLTPSQAIINTVTIAMPGYEPIVRSATIIVNPHEVYLPLILKENSL